MKIIEIETGDFMEEKILRPIRNKRDIIILLLETLKYFENENKNVDNKTGKITICIDKMSRVFYQTKGKLFSFVFPFSAEQQGEWYKFYDNLTELELDGRMVSLLISIFKKDGVLEDSLEKAMDFIIDRVEEYEYKNIDDIWRLIFKLWYMEEGYIRFDSDAMHENGKLHPLHHFDINYSSGVTYKIGVKVPVEMEKFRDILNTGTECEYLEIVS